ncbi:MAG: hypothetical protein QME75_05825 [Deltaproteobacteria bacterium]|nr:hypothetical protein [Deltaproteobacteria bacterium]
MESLTEGKKLLGAAMLIMLVLLVLNRPAGAAPDPWPKRLEHPKGTVILYQPQVEDLKGDKLAAYAAVSVQKKEWKQPEFGVLWLTGRVVTDRDTRMATIDEVKVTDAKFHDAKPEQLENLKTFVNQEIKDWSTTISLDRLLAALALVEKEHAADAGLKNEPPKVIFKSHPAVLVPLDGEPKLLPIPDSKLMRVANTPFIMAYDPEGKAYYLKGGDAWLSASEVTGQWQDVKTLPGPVQSLAAKMKEAEQKAVPKTGKQPARKEVEKTAGEMPEVIVSTEPAELLVTDGEPQFTPIKGTDLLFVSNTESNIFMDTGSQEYYTLLSGRWFKSKSLQDGPWSYMAPDQLPGDFAKIPPESTKGFVLVNVAGSQQAKEAVLDNHIPQTAAIDRKKATTQVKYAGDPKFDKISGTDLEYAVNTGKTVFKQGTKYYAVDQGVWYEADSAHGPWKVSVHPPEEVNKIPPSNPHYNAKYVKVYDSTADTAYVGYTPGYTGSYVNNGTIVYGTGYNYPSYSTPSTYIPPAAPATYGYAAAYDPYASTWGYQPSYYNPYSWLGPSLVGFGMGVLTGYAIWGHDNYYGGGWWGGGGYHYTNININHNYIYNRNWNPGKRWPDGRPIIHPVVSPANRPNIYNRPGNENRLVSRAGDRHGVGPDRPGQAGRPRPDTRPASRQVSPAGGKNNVFADKGGNVYRRDPQGNWQQRQGNQWTRPPAADRPASRPRPAEQVSRPGGFQPSQRPADITQRSPRPSSEARPGFDAGRMNSEFQARERGQMRTQSFQRAQGSPAFLGGGGFGRPSGGFSRPGGGGFRGGRR